MSKVWFVTGASSGIGAGVVKAALEAGRPRRRHGAQRGEAAIRDRPARE